MLNLCDMQCTVNEVWYLVKQVIQRFVHRLKIT